MSVVDRRTPLQKFACEFQPALSDIRSFFDSVHQRIFQRLLRRNWNPIGNHCQGLINANQTG